MYEQFHTLTSSHFYSTHNPNQINTFTIHQGDISSPSITTQASSNFSDPFKGAETLQKTKLTARIKSNDIF